MTEKIESMEIHPMRGHSRGEWYCSLDDIAPSEEEAEYWAIFGVTHRGNKHCLGEFLTKAAADTAVHGLQSLWAPPEPSPPRRGRKVIQIEVVAEKNDSAMVDIFALCDDGSIWRRGIGTGRHSGLIDNQWERIPLDGIEDLAPEEAFGVVIASTH
jgi:hypothetical protein